MDLLNQLNHFCPGTSNAAPFHLSQQPPGYPHHAPIPSIQSTQDQTHPGHGDAYSDPSTVVHTRSSLDFTVGHDLRPLKSSLVGLQSAVHSDPEHLMEIYPMDESATLSDQYVPSSQDKITCADHRPLDEIFGGLHLSLGWSQPTSGLLHPSLNGTPRGHPRHTSVFTYTLPTKPQLEGVVQIPLLAVDNQMCGTGLVVVFRCSDWGIGVQLEGISMSDLLHGDVSGLESPNQHVLDGFGITSLRLNILWPQYPPFAKMISPFSLNGKPVARAELGYQVSLAFAEFFHHITSHSILPARPGPYVISPSPPGSPSPGIRFEQLHLITVRNTSRGEWMAEVRAVSIS